MRQAPVKLTVEVRCSAPGYSSYYVTTLQPTSYHCISVTMTMFSIVALCVLCQTANAIKTHFVFWNTTNPIFRLDNTDNVIDVNVGNLPWEYDQLNLICPQNSPEQHVVYSVSEEEYNSCRVTNPRPKIVAICNKPSDFMYFTITFRSFSPTPGGLEFKPGQNYYFISTSTQRDIHRRAGGFCSSHNMKMIFKVADNNKETSNDDNLLPLNLNHPRQVPASLRGQPQYPRVWNSRVPSMRNDFIYYYKPWSAQARYSRHSTVGQHSALNSNEIVSQPLPFTASSAASKSISLVICTITLFVRQLLH